MLHCTINDDIAPSSLAPVDAVAHEWTGPVLRPQAVKLTGAFEPDSQALVEIIELKWLLAGEGFHVHVERLQTDRDYARQALHRAPSTGVPVDLVLDPRSPVGNRVLYAAFVGKGVYKSVDDGKTWTEKNNGVTGNMNAWRLIQLPNGTLYLLVCRGWKNEKVIDGAMYISHDGAENWQAINLPRGVNFPNDLCFDPQNPNRMYLATWTTLGDEIETHGGLYRTEDGGVTWTNIFDASSHVYGVKVDKNNPATVILTNFEGAVMRSNNYGQTWKRLEGFTFKWAKQPIFDPHNYDMLYVTTFGSSLWYGSAHGVEKVFDV